MKHTKMMTEETQLIANSSQINSSELSSMQRKRQYRILGAVALCITFFGVGLRVSITNTDTIIVSNGDSGGVPASMMAVQLTSSTRAPFAAPSPPLGGSNPTNPDTSIIEDVSGICSLPSPPSRTYNSKTDYCFVIFPDNPTPLHCWTDNYDCLPIYGPWNGVSGVGDNQCGPACASPESGWNNFAVRTRYCYESHGSYDSQHDYCFGSDGGKRCWSHQDCKPLGPWGGLSGIGNNNCGDPCKTFEDNKIFTAGCCTITDLRAKHGLSTTLEIYNKQECHAYKEFPLAGEWNNNCDCLTKNGKWTGWNNECGYHD